ncbi:FadR family transcriptional regulator [Acidaminobacter sp. JC074]|uniref:FadR/GntR family transcriptional regulator n=1 Tax=Acidaminobacter sp. JC074 TaxID=2530199 RepID=UPI001F0F98DE|nr:FCD domain-containing protein [Acidaminobacter sp. JC074]MCH4886918.1 FadR family transcriptional regulator [Acidaminobacter sp. JC074]
MFERIVVHDKIVKEVKRYIIENQLKIGDKLPSQQEFVKMYGLSKNSMREAFRTLQALKIVEIINGKGMYVHNNNFHFDESVVSDRKKHLKDILSVRRSLEILAAQNAVREATNEDIEGLRHAIKLMKEKEISGEPHAKEDKAFHYGIFEASHNQVLIDATSYLEGWFNEMWSNPLDAGKAFREGLDYHSEIVDALENKDEKTLLKAYNKMFDQIEVIIENI